MINHKTLDLLLDDRVQMPRMFSYDEVQILLKEYKNKIEKDLLQIADDGEIEDLRREVTRYFEDNKLR